MAHTVIGMFDSASEAQQAVQQLVSSGISRDNIDISSANSGTSGSYAGSSSDTGYSSNTGDSGTTAGSGSLGFPGAGGFSDSNAGSTGFGGTGLGTTGGGTGLSGTGLGSTGFGGSSSGSTDLSDLSSGRSSSGGYDNDNKESGITKFFKSLFGGNDDDVNTYSNVAQRSGSIITVHAQSKDEAEIAADILDSNGAVDVNERASQYGMGSSTTDTGNTFTDTGNTFTGTGTNEGSSINVIEEQLEVGKRQVQTGGVRLRSRIVETPVEESLRLREERVTVERHTVNRPATDADFANFKETSIELTEQAEVPVVSKQARVVEEISLDKQVTERDETIRDTVRSTEVDVENLESKNTRTGSSTSSDNDLLDTKNNF